MAETWAILILPKFQADIFSFHNQVSTETMRRERLLPYPIAGYTGHQASLTVGEAC